MVPYIHRSLYNCLQFLVLLHFAVWSLEDGESIVKDGNDDKTTDGIQGNITNFTQPHFLHDHLTLNISAQLDSTVHLHCRISGINDQAVSWYRKKGSEIHLITVGFQTYHNDDRFALVFSQPEDWQLRIRYVQRRDEGTYQCQVSSHPPLIRTIHLQVVEASIQILDRRGQEVDEKFYRVGSTLELICHISDIPSATSLHIAWFHRLRRINYDGSRGGVSLKTELRGSRAKSWLRVSNAVQEDSGTYYCNVTNLASANVTIHVVTDEYPAAIQRASNPCLWNAVLLVSTLVSLGAICNLPHR